MLDGVTVYGDLMDIKPINFRKVDQKTQETSLFQDNVDQAFIQMSLNNQKLVEGIEALGSVPELQFYNIFATTCTGTPARTSAAFADITGISGTKTTLAGTYMVFFRTSVGKDASAINVQFQVDVDSGTQTIGTSNWISRVDVNFQRNYALFISTVQLTAASHTFKGQWKTISGTANAGFADSNDNFQLDILRIGA